jgi:DHA1 family tetracycline resistance protein-like MFS transporter
LIGLMFGMGGFLAYGLAVTGTFVWPGLPLIALWGIYGAASQGLMSRMVGASEQGQLQGAVNSLRGITGMIGPGLFTTIFAAFIGPLSAWNLPGAPFLLAAALLAIAAILAWNVTRARTAAD